MMIATGLIMTNFSTCRAKGGGSQEQAAGGLSSRSGREVSIIVQLKNAVHVFSKREGLVSFIQGNEENNLKCL